MDLPRFVARQLRLARCDRECEQDAIPARGERGQHEMESLRGAGGASLGRWQSPGAGTPSEHTAPKRAARRSSRRRPPPQGRQPDASEHQDAYTQWVGRTRAGLQARLYRLARVLTRRAEWFVDDPMEGTAASRDDGRAMNLGHRVGVSSTPEGGQRVEAGAPRLEHESVFAASSHQPVPAVDDLYRSRFHQDARTARPAGTRAASAIFGRRRGHVHDHRVDRSATRAPRPGARPSASKGSRAPNGPNTRCEPVAHTMD